MWSDPQYLHSWRDLRRRELLFWFFVLSYVPGMLLIIAAVDVIGRDLPEHIKDFVERSTRRVRRLAASPSGYSPSPARFGC